MNRVEIVKIGKKAKFKTLDQIIKVVKKENLHFNFDGFDVEIDHDDGTFYCHHTDLGKEVTINSAEVEYGNDGSVSHIIYHSKDDEYHSEDLKFFSKFPKLTKKQIPTPKAPIILKRGSGVPNHDMIINDSGTLTVGCQTLSKTQIENVFKFLAKNLEYSLEE